MDIKKFLESEYSYENFKKFIFDKFYGFEENNIDYEEPDTNIEQKHILKYKFMGSCQLDDKKEIGFFEVITTEKTDIENNRVSLGNILKNKYKNLVNSKNNVNLQSVKHTELTDCSFKK